MEGTGPKLDLDKFLNANPDIIKRVLRQEKRKRKHCTCNKCEWFEMLLDMDTQDALTLNVILGIDQVDMSHHYVGTDTETSDSDDTEGESSLRDEPNHLGQNAAQEEADTVDNENDFEAEPGVDGGETSNVVNLEDNTKDLNETDSVSDTERDFTSERISTGLSEKYLESESDSQDRGKQSNGLTLEDVSEDFNGIDSGSESKDTAGDLTLGKSPEGLNEVFSDVNVKVAIESENVENDFTLGDSSEGSVKMYPESDVDVTIEPENTQE